VYVPSIYPKYKNQLIDIEQRMNDDLLKLQEYAERWHQPVNSEKTQFVIYTQIVNHLKLNINYENSPLEQTKTFKYLGYVLDTRLSFKPLVD
jgi:hypothetical protein